MSRYVTSSSSAAAPSPTLPLSISDSVRFLPVELASDKARGRTQHEDLPCGAGGVSRAHVSLAACRLTDLTFCRPDRAATLLTAGVAGSCGQHDDGDRPWYF
jgi:hypothetical protein